MDSETVQGDPVPGMTFGSYRIERLLGSGGMGAVFLAYDTALHRPVAVKVMTGPTDGETSRSRLLREARNAAALNHPNICCARNGRTFPESSSEHGAGNPSAMTRINYWRAPTAKYMRL